jgi:hypothetical protein
LRYFIDILDIYQRYIRDVLEINGRFFRVILEIYILIQTIRQLLL